MPGMPCRTTSTCGVSGSSSQKRREAVAEPRPCQPRRDFFARDGRLRACTHARNHLQRGPLRSDNLCGRAPRGPRGRPRRSRGRASSLEVPIWMRLPLNHGVSLAWTMILAPRPREFASPCTESSLRLRRLCVAFPLAERAARQREVTAGTLPPGLPRRRSLLR